MLPQVGLGDELLHNHIHHGPGGEGQQPGHEGLDRPRRQHHQDTEDRLHHAGGAAVEESPPGGQPLLPQGQGDGRPLREVLDSNSQSQRQGPGQGRPLTGVLGGQGEGQADGHPLRDVVQRHGQHQQGGAPPGGVEPLGLPGIHMEVGQQHIQQQQEADAQHEAPHRRQPARKSGGLRLLHGGDEQAPHRGGDHHPGGKAQKDTLDGRIELLSEQKDHGGAQSGHQKSEAGTRGRP